MVLTNRDCQTVLDICECADPGANFMKLLSTEICLAWNISAQQAQAGSQNIMQCTLGLAGLQSKCVKQ